MHALPPGLAGRHPDRRIEQSSDRDRVPRGRYRNRDTSLHPTVLTWSTDGEWVYAFEADSSAIMRYSISGPEVEVVLKVDCKFVESATSDGTRFICTSYEHLLDLWLARNLPASVPMAAGDRD